MSKLKILHLIDSLALGGAERVAVNMVNELSAQGAEAHLCATRKGGPLQEFLSDDVKFSILNKRGAFDIAAMWRLIRYIRHNKIQIVHAHSSSVYLAAMVKLFCRFKLVWHDHYGGSENLNQRNCKTLKRIASCFDYVYSVNILLREWSINELRLPSTKVEYLQNFANISNETHNETLLPTNNGGYKIVCLANLREQKNHLMLLNAVKVLKTQCDIYLVGNDNNDLYSNTVHEYIKDNNLSSVFVLGARSDVSNILSMCDIAVLSSSSEGLPVSLLEYGLAGLPVVCTNVGECATVLENGRHGILVESGDYKAMAKAIDTLAENKETRDQYAHSFQNHVNKVYSKEAIIKSVINRYNMLLDGK